MPSRSATPGRNPSISTSTPAIRSSATPAAPGRRRSSPTERRPRPERAARAQDGGQRVGAGLQPVDPDHLGTEVGEQHPEEGHRPDGRQLQDPDPVERAGGVRHQNVSPFAALATSSSGGLNRSPYRSASCSARARKPGRPALPAALPVLAAVWPVPR